MAKFIIENLTSEQAKLISDWFVESGEQELDDWVEEYLPEQPLYFDPVPWETSEGWHVTTRDMSESDDNVDSEIDELLGISEEDKHLRGKKSNE